MQSIFSLTVNRHELALQERRTSHFKRWRVAASEAMRHSRDELRKLASSLSLIKNSSSAKEAAERERKKQAPSAWAEKVCVCVSAGDAAAIAPGNDNIGQKSAGTYLWLMPSRRLSPKR